MFSPVKRRGFDSRIAFKRKKVSLMKLKHLAIVYLSLFIPFSVFVKLCVLDDLSLFSSSLNVNLKSYPFYTQPILKSAKDKDLASLEDLISKKKLSLIQFWNTSCTECRLDMPRLERIYEEHANKEFSIIVITLRGSLSEVQTYLSDIPLSLPIYVDNSNQLLAQLKPKTLPSGLLVSSNGTIIKAYSGRSSLLESDLARRLGHDQSK